MKIWHNIAKALTNLFGRLQLLPLGRRLGGGFVLVALMLLGGLRYAHAQNNSANPYINSTHLYRVPMGDVNNRVEWYITNDATPVTIPLNNALAWADSGRVDNTSPILDSAYIEIKFVNTVFQGVSGPWTLVYSEFNGSNCVARRGFVITPVANLFALATASNPVATCNVFSDNVWPNDLNIESPRNLAVSFVVNMNKHLDHIVKKWEFNGTVTVNGPSGYSIPAEAEFITTLTGTSARGTYAITNISGGSFTLSVTIDTDDAAYVNHATDQVGFTVYVSGLATNDVSATLTISGGNAESGLNYTVVTDDNNTGSHTQVVTYRGIPKTMAITLND